MTKKVLFVRSDIQRTGPGILMLSSAKALRDAGVEVTFATGGGDLVEDIAKHSFRHITIPELRIENRSIISSAKAAFKLGSICRQGRFDIIHSYNAHAGLCGLPAAKILAVPIFNTVLGNGKENLLKHLPLRLVAVSNSVKDKLLSHGIPPHRIHVIYNATLDSRFLLRDESELEELFKIRATQSPLTFISVAGFTGFKGHKQILKAAFEYREKGYRQPIKVKFIGDGEKMSDLKRMASKLELDDMVEFCGASKQVERHLDAAHVFIHLAEMETFGIVLAEASARGLPCIASNVGGIPEVVQEGKTGFLVDWNDADQVAHRMNELAGSQKLREELGAAGAAYANEFFSRDKMAKDLKILYGIK